MKRLLASLALAALLPQTVFAQALPGTPARDEVVFAPFFLPWRDILSLGIPGFGAGPPAAPSVIAAIQTPVTDGGVSADGP